MKRNYPNGKGTIAVLHLFRNPGAATAFDPDAFFGREDELSSLLRVCLDGSRGVGAAVMLSGPPEAGKTSLLLKLESAILEQPAVMIPRAFPFYFAFSNVHSTPIELSGQFLREYLGQLLSFVKPGTSGMVAPEEACDRLEASGFKSCRELLAAHMRHVASGDAVSALVNAFSAPFAASDSTVYPVLLLDDFQFASKIEGVPDGSVLSILRPFIKAARFPFVLSGSTPGRITSELKREGLYGVFRMMETGRLSAEGGARLWNSLCERREFSVPFPVCERAVDRLGAIPAYLRMLADEISFSGAEVRDEIDFENLYAASVTGGGLNRYWKEIFENLVPDRAVRGRTVRFLKRVLCDRFPLDTVEGALTLYGASPREGEEALTALELKGLVRTDFEHIEFHRDPVLEDFLTWAVERGAMGRTSSQVASDIVQSRLSRASATLTDSEQESFRDTVKQLMQRWDCREVPALLFDFGKFIDRYGEKGLLEIMVGLEHEPSMLRLPKISAVSRGYRADRAGSRFDFDLVGYGFQGGDYSEDRMVAWAVDVDPGKTLTRAAVEHFENRTRLLALEKTLPAERLCKWLLFGEAVEPGAIELAAAFGIHLTHRSQLRLFLNLFGMEETQQPSGPSAPPESSRFPARSPASDAVEFTLVLPKKADTEMVAGRVAEEIAGWALLDVDAIARLKMAIIEACINTFEHGVSGSGRVQIRYLFSPGKIEIFVRDDGNGFRRPEDAGTAKDRSRALKLMRELVDEAEIDDGNSGSGIRLAMHVDRTSAAPGHPVVVDAC